MTREARHYLAPTHETFWQWKDNTEVVAWMDGKTIAFRAEIQQILRRLAPHGLPPFGAIVLLLAATRENWREASTEPGILSGILHGGVAYDLEKSDLLAEVLAGLDKVSMLDADLRTSSVAKEALAEMVFEGLLDRGSAKSASEVVDLLRDGLGEEDMFRRGSRQSLDIGSRELVRELRDLRPGIHRVQSDALKLHLETGLDELPEPVDLELTPAERVRALLARMKNDNELHGLAALALQLMAAVTLPRSVSERDEMPMGGFSDIANRGPLDRLLLSELAHDNLTLAVRVAVNEALYLRRESPPKTPPQQRAIFLDAGIRTWGVPRIFATAVALALAASVDKHNDIVAYRAAGTDTEPVDLTTRAGLVSHLAALEPHAHPGDALLAFKAETNQAADASEPVFVTTEDVLADPEFQLAMSRHEFAPVLIASVTRAGEFRLYERTTHGTRLLREAKFELDALFANPQQVVPTLVNREWARDRPAILSVEPFPLLLPHNLKPKLHWSVAGSGMLALTGDRRLMWWGGSKEGARQLSDEIPKGALWWASRDATNENRVRAVVGYLDRNGLSLLDIDLANQRCEIKPLNLNRGVHAICSHNGALLAIDREAVHLYDEASGEFARAVELSTGTIYRRGRFFQFFPGEQWFAMSSDGLRVQFERALATNDVRCPKLQTMFEKDGVDGPIGVTEHGDLYWTTTSELRKVQHGLSQPRVEAILPDGQRMVLTETSNYKKYVLVDVETLRTEMFYSDPFAAAEVHGQKLHVLSLRNRFTYIFVDERGKLTLESRKQRHFAIDYDPASDRIRLRANNGCRASDKKLIFKEVNTSPRIGYQLTVATWDDGSQAFLDSRGLLHLKSSDTRSVPEATIVLNDGELSGWCADGSLWGTRYFIGNRNSVAKKKVFDSAIRAFAERAI